MTPLGRKLAERIADYGPVSVAEYMEACLGDPDHGYYMTRDPFGVDGDFTTAPEVSQMFGELVGAWLAQVWLDQGAPDRFVLAEAGPGRGTLMQDALRVLRRVPGYLEAAQVCCVEMSPMLKSLQRERLKDYDVTWVDSIDDLPGGPLFLVANEFFDALPVRQFQRVDGFWRERLITARDGELTYAWGRPAHDIELDLGFGMVADGSLVEVCPMAAALAQTIGGRLAQGGGAALVVDYGEWDGTGDTLQALRRHRPVDPLQDSGEADLTAHVRFRALAEAVPSKVVCHLTTQASFLKQLGIEARAAALAVGKAQTTADQVAASLTRLTHPKEMGTLYKVLALTPGTAAKPPGFSE